MALPAPPAPASTKSAITPAVRERRRRKAFSSWPRRSLHPARRAADKDLYIHEIIARWAGWSLSVPFPGKVVQSPWRPGQGHPARRRRSRPTAPTSRHPFKVRATYKVNRARCRACDSAGAIACAPAPSISPATAWRLNEPFGEPWRGDGLPADPEGLVYLRYEPCRAAGGDSRRRGGHVAPARPATDWSSARSTPRSTRTGRRPTSGRRPPHRAAAHQRRTGRAHGHVRRPRRQAEDRRRTWDLAVAATRGSCPAPPSRSRARSRRAPAGPGRRDRPAASLPDLLSRGAALRDLPGTGDGTIGQASPGDGPPGRSLPAAGRINPGRVRRRWYRSTPATTGRRPLGFRFALAEPAGDAAMPPSWDPATRVLTVSCRRARPRWYRSAATCPAAISS